MKLTECDAFFITNPFEKFVRVKTLRGGVPFLTRYLSYRVVAGLLWGG